MIIQRLASKCCSPDATGMRIAQVLDWITALALLIIGALGASGVLALSPAVAYSLLGAGVVYTIMMLLSISREIRCST